MTQEKHVFVFDRDSDTASMRILLSQQGFKITEVNWGKLSDVPEISRYQIVILCMQRDLPNGRNFTSELFKYLTDKRIQVIPVIGSCAEHDFNMITEIVKSVDQHSNLYSIFDRDKNTILEIVHRHFSKNAPEAEEMTVEEVTMIYKSDAMRKIDESIQIAAESDITVLITGETGVGKGVVAQKIHQLSKRKDRSFVRKTLAVLSGSLFESELFGHVKGAYTGAYNDKKGVFEQANGGTLFLDEIGDVPLDLQVKILQVLDDGTFSRVGDPELVKVDIRLIAATNQSLPELIRNGRFREDLYYRLSVFPISIPPLRERREDILVLAQHFLSKINKREKKSISGFLNEALTEMNAYPWPGNARELYNKIERAVVFCRGNNISSLDLEYKTSSLSKKESGILAVATVPELSSQPAESPHTSSTGSEDIGLTWVNQELLSTLHEINHGWPDDEASHRTEKIHYLITAWALRIGKKNYKKAGLYWILMAIRSQMSMDGATADEAEIRERLKLKNIEQYHNCTNTDRWNFAQDDFPSTFFEHEIKKLLNEIQSRRYVNTNEHGKPDSGSEPQVSEMPAGGSSGAGGRDGTGKQGVYLEALYSKLSRALSKRRTQIIIAIAVTAILVFAVLGWSFFQKHRAPRSLWKLEQPIGVVKEHPRDLSGALGLSEDEIIAIPSSQLPKIGSGYGIMKIEYRGSEFRSVTFLKNTPFEKTQAIDPPYRKLHFHGAVSIEQGNIQDSSSHKGYGTLDVYSMSPTGILTLLNGRSPIFFIPSQLSAKHFDEIVRSSADPAGMTLLLNSAYQRKEGVLSLDSELQDYLLDVNRGTTTANRIMELASELPVGLGERFSDFSFEIPAPGGESGEIAMAVNYGSWAIVIEKLEIEGSD
jgi:DNA-binding NtrC family response regulator